MAYLLQTRDIPLVLGGEEEITIIGISDASLATGPKCRSIIGTIVRLGKNAGAIRAKTKAMDSVVLSSYVGENNGYSECFKNTARGLNFWMELDFTRTTRPMRRIEGDNMKALQWITGDAEGNGMKHGEMRLFSMQREYNAGGIEVKWIPGTEMPCDSMTKVVPRLQHIGFVKDIQGLQLLSPALQDHYGRIIDRGKEGEVLATVQAATGTHSLLEVSESSLGGADTDWQEVKGKRRKGA
jgi:hypothetical protein